VPRDDPEQVCAERVLRADTWWRSAMRDDLLGCGMHVPAGSRAARRRVGAARADGDAMAGEINTLGLHAHTPQRVRAAAPVRRCPLRTTTRSLEMEACIGAGAPRGRTRTPKNAKSSHSASMRTPHSELGLQRPSGGALYAPLLGASKWRPASVQGRSKGR